MSVEGSTRQRMTRDLRNPVLPGDYSDLDCIRVGSDYYAISSTFQYSPGMVILHSKDLVNWTIVGHAIDDVTQISPRCTYERYARGGGPVRSTTTGSSGFISARRTRAIS